MDFEIFVCSFAMDSRELVRVCGKLSGMSDCILYLPQVYLSHNGRPYVGKKSEHRSDLVPGGGLNTDPDHILCAPVFFQKQENILRRFC